MSIPVSQQQLIEKYFNLLVNEFITDSRHNEDISIVFQDYLESSKPGSTTMGHTRQISWITWYENVPGSKKTTYKYVVTFLNRYEDENELRGAVVHEFAHLYLYATVGGKHKHDKRFYSTMEFMENWLNKNQGLSPRVDKSHDYDQYEDNHSEIVDNKENACPECSYPSPNHSPQCSQNINKPHPRPGQNQKPNITNDLQTATELDHLKNLLNSSRDLPALESIYQNKIKTSSLYQGDNDNKKTLENAYLWQKYFLQSSNNNQRFSTNPSNKSELGSREYFLIASVVMIIVLTVIIVYLLMSEPSTSKPKKKR